MTLAQGTNLYPLNITTADGQEATILDFDGLAAYPSYAQSYSAWLASEPERHPSIILSAKMRPAVKDGGDATPSAGSDQRPPTTGRNQEGDRAIDYLARVVYAAGGELDRLLTLTRMREIGYPGTSKHPESDLLDKVKRKYGNYATTDGKTFKLTTTGRELANRLPLLSATSEIGEQAPDVSSNSDGVERTPTFEYMLHAAYDLGAKAQGDEMVKLMLERGWFTTSPTLESQKTVVSAVVSKNLDIFSRLPGGGYVLTELGLQRLRDLGVDVNENEYFSKTSSSSIEAEATTRELDLQS